MKKFALFALLLMTSLFVLPVGAQDDAQALAQYFPSDTPFYLSFRTDDDFIGTVDQLLVKLDRVLPDADFDESFREILDDAADDIQDDGTFASVIRPWLGDEGAFGVYTLDEDAMNREVPPLVIALSLTDADAAKAFFQANAELEDYTEIAGDGFTLYAPLSGNADNPHVVIRSDVVILTNSPEIGEAGGIIAAPLSENPAFDMALGTLPLASYDAVAYLDTPSFFDAIMREQGGVSAEELAMITPMMNALHPQAFGFDIVDERTLVFDFASPLAADAELPFAMPVTEPIDPAFAAHIPANTTLVVQGTNLYQSYQSGVQNLRQLVETMSETNEDVDVRQLNAVMFGINFAVRGVTGLTTDEAFGWMTGDYALAVGLSPSLADASSISAASNALPVDFALVLEVTDAAAVQTLFSGMSESLTGLDADNMQLEILEDAIHVTLTPDDTPFPVELTIAKNDEVFVIGTERMVRAALTPATGMDTDAAFNAASAHMLSNANALLYVGSHSLTPLARVLSASSNPPRIQEQGQEMKAALEAFDSLTISSSALPDNAGSLMRFVWLLPE